MGDGVTTGALKLTNPLLHHAPGFAVIAAGVFGFPEIVIVLGMLVPGVQAVELAVTVKYPLVNAGETLSMIEVLPCPLVMVVPAGFVHV
jgi:hypothetical protein